MTARRLSLDSLPDWPRWMREDNAAAYCDISTGTFRALVAEGKLPAGQLLSARIRLYDRHAIDAALERLSSPEAGRPRAFGEHDSWERFR